MGIIEQLKTFNADRADIEDLVALSAQGSAVAAGFDAVKLPQPEWLKDVNAALQAEIKRRRIDQLQLALKQARAKQDGLKTAEQKRQEVGNEIAQLEAMLAEK